MTGNVEEIRGEVDLREYLDLIRRYFWFIAAIFSLAVIGSALSNRMATPVYEARASVLVMPSKTEVSFEPKIKTTTENLGTGDSGTVLRQTLVQLVPNGVVESLVINKLGSVLLPEERQAGGLVGKVKGNIDTKGNIIEIVATTEDPKRSMQIANAWAEAFAQYTNDLYGGLAAASTFTGQLTTAKTEYEKAQASYTMFIGESSETALANSLREKESILSALQESKAIAIRSVITAEVGLQSQLAAEYANNYNANRLIALTKDREATSKLLSSYLEAANSARAEAFSQQARAKLQTLADYYASKNKVERLLADAQALRRQVDGQGDSGSSASNGLAIALLKAQAFASSENLPASLQIQLNFDGTFSSSRSAQLEDLDTLVRVLSERQSQLDASIYQKSMDISVNKGYDVFERPLPENDPLFAAAKQQYGKLFQTGPLTRLGEETAVSKEIQEQISREARGILELPDISRILASSVNTSTVQFSNQLVVEINRNKQQLSQEQAKRQELERARDLAWETYLSLARKSAEVAVSSQASTVVLRLAAPALEPRSPRQADTKNLLVPALASLIGAVMAAFAIDYFRRPARFSGKG